MTGHLSVFQAPSVRKTSCRGGGLITYLDKRVCYSDDIKKHKFKSRAKYIYDQFLITKV